MSVDVVVAKVTQWVPVPMKTQLGAMSMGLMAVCVWDSTSASDREKIAMRGRCCVSLVEGGSLYVAPGAIDGATTFQVPVDVFPKRQGGLINAT